jgi:oxaloacetate decarboxylase (Na+ extruding) subunit gamma
MNELMSSGIELMLTGMGIVYAFLALLVVTIKMMTALVSRFFPETPLEFAAVPDNSSEPQVIAAITAAVHQYRSQQK